MIAERHHDDESTVLKREREAFAKRESALRKMRAQFVVPDAGRLSLSIASEFDAADAEWKAATADIERIAAEIRTGKRR